MMRDSEQKAAEREDRRDREFSTFLQSQQAMFGTLVDVLRQSLAAPQPPTPQPASLVMPPPHAYPSHVQYGTQPLAHGTPFPNFSPRPRFYPTPGLPSPSFQPTSSMQSGPEQQWEAQDNCGSPKNFHDM